MSDPAGTDEIAKTIYQDFLDRMGNALVEGDMETFAAHIFLPHTIMTEDQNIELTDTDAVMRHTIGFSNAIRSQGIDTYARVARSARFVTPEKIVGEHSSFMLARGKLTVPRFENTMTLEWRHGIWGCAQTRHLTRYVSFPDLLPRARRDD